MVFKAGTVVLLILNGVITVQGGTCNPPAGTCYYYKDPCPEGQEPCSLTCELSTNTCCCPKGDIEFAMADAAQGCDDLCGEQNKVCVPEGFQGEDVKQLFEDLGQTCKTEEAYWASDQPCYAFSREHCYGTTELPDEIDCATGGNPAVKRLCPCDCEGGYFMADPAESCDSQCEKRGMVCAPEGFKGKDVKQLFESLGKTCKTEESYWASDQPCYAFSREHCYGTTGLPDEIDCATGGNPAVQRLCPCTCQ